MNQIILKDNQSDYFDLITYPDGQHSIKLRQDKLDLKKPVWIKCRIKTFSELEVLLCLTTTLERLGYFLQRLDFIYLFGMRSDRPFSADEPNYFKDVVAPVINLIRCRMIFLYEPHASVNTWSIRDCNTCSTLAGMEQADAFLDMKKKYCLIGGDASSRERATFFIDWEFVKKRTSSGLTLELSLNNPVSLCQDILIVDDLCDGGATFIAGAKYLRNLGFENKLCLYVTHGLFTKGLAPLLAHFDHIYCTNSYQDIDHPKVTQYKVI